jgi:hypothetical protein
MVDARLANSSVWPSGAAFITSMTPILVAAPGMFSTTMVPLRYLASGPLQGAADDVVRAARSERDDDADRLAGIGLRVRKAAPRSRKVRRQAELQRLWKISWCLLNG